MSSNEESQTMPTDKDIKINNVNFIDEVKEKETNGEQQEGEKGEVKMQEVNDIIMNKDNEQNIHLTTLNDIIEIKQEENIDNNNNNINNNIIISNSNEIKEEKEAEIVNEIKEEIIEEPKKEEINEEKKEEINEEKKEEINQEINEEKKEEINQESNQDINQLIKEEKIEIKEKEEEEEESLRSIKDIKENENNNDNSNNDNNDKIEIKSISNKSRSHSKSSSKKNTNKQQLEFSESNTSIKLNSIKKEKKEPQSQKIQSKNIKPKFPKKQSTDITTKKKYHIKKINSDLINQEKTRKPKKKYNEAEFQKELEFFEQCEKRKKERIEKLKQDKIKKEIETVNNKKNIHYHKKLSNKKLPSLLERIYTRDIKKRKEKKQILAKIYTPSFTPFLYTKGNINLIKRQTLYKQGNSLTKRYPEPLEENNEENNNYNESQNIIINNSKVKFNMKENIQVSDDGEENEGSPRIYNRVEVENAMRNKLFSNKKRNKSAETRRKKN